MTLSVTFSVYTLFATESSSRPRWKMPQSRIFIFVTTAFMFREVLVLNEIIDQVLIDLLYSFVNNFQIVVVLKGARQFISILRY